MGDWGIWGYCFFHQITSINQTQLSSAIKLHVCFGKRRGLDSQRYYFTNGNKANWRMRIYAYAHSRCLTSIIGDKKGNISTLGSLHYNMIKHYVSSFNLTNKTLAIISLGFPEKNDDIDYWTFCGFCRILPYFPLFTTTLPYWSETVGGFGGEQSWMKKNSQRQDYDLAVMRKRGLWGWMGR